MAAKASSSKLSPGMHSTGLPLRHRSGSVFPSTFASAFSSWARGEVLLCRLCTLLVYISVRRKVVDKLSDRIADAAHLIFIERTALRVSLCEPEPSNRISS